MTAVQLRKQLKREIDRLSPDRLKSAADFLGYLMRPTIEDRIAQAEEDIKAGRVTPWRKVRKDV